MKAGPRSPPRCHAGSVLPSFSCRVWAIGHIPTELRPGVALIPCPHGATSPMVLCVKDEPCVWELVGHRMGNGGGLGMP